MQTVRMRIIKATALTLTVVLSAGCFEEPVSEKVIVEVRPDRTVDVKTLVEIRPSSDNPGLMRRLEETRQRFLHGNDAWSRRYDALDPMEESFQWSKKDGKLSRIERWSRADDLRLPFFFSDTALTLTLTRTTEGGELAIYPGRPRGATDAQSRELEREIARWSDSLENYFQALDALYVYLDANPHRSYALLAPFFADALSQDERDALVEPAEEELALAERVSQTLFDIAEVLVVDETRDVTLDELSRLVYDPFPSDLTVIVPGEAAEIAGFERRDERSVTVRRLSLWDALASLDQKWASPDLIVPWVAMQQGEEVNVTAIVGASRRISKPKASEIRRAIEARLAPESVYRVRWKQQGAAVSNELSQ